MRAKQLGKTLNDRGLNRLIHPLRFIDNWTNLLYLGVDYLSLAVILTASVTFLVRYDDWGLSVLWCVPVVILSSFLVGAVQHRLAGLAHEGAHYILLRNRVLNELVSDLFCMFPLFSTTDQYRCIHLGHHEFTNDWERDPELLNLGSTRKMDQFPMSRWRFIYQFYVRILWPPAFLRYIFDNIYVTSLGNGLHPYAQRIGGSRPMLIKNVRLTTALGVAYLAVMVAVQGYLSWFGTTPQLLAAAVGMWLAASAVACALPEQWYFPSPMRPVYSNKITSVLRLGYITGLECVLAYGRQATGLEWGAYFWLLWILPLFTTFPYYMLLRDLYQHANADDGKLTNSRVVFCDPFSRWAIFIYGQDAHLTHHLYPAVPHYNLMKLHSLLEQNNQEYAQHVVECHGTFFHRQPPCPTLLEVMEKPTCEPWAESVPPPMHFPPRRVSADTTTKPSQPTDA